MLTQYATVYLHVLLAVALVGYGLFWFILSRRRSDAYGEEEEALFDDVARSPWPPKGIPAPVRLPLVGIGWVLFLGVVLTGVARLGIPGVRYAFSSGAIELFSLATKLVAVGLAAVLLTLVSWRPRRPVIGLLFLVLLAIVSISAVIVR